MLLYDIFPPSSIFWSSSIYTFIREAVNKRVLLFMAGPLRPYPPPPPHGIFFFLQFQKFQKFRKFVFFLNGPAIKSRTFFCGFPKRIVKLWLWNDGLKMNEGVKISKSNIWPIMLEMTDLHDSSLKHLKYLLLTFYRQLKFPLIQIWTRGWIKHIKIDSLNLPQWIFGENSFYLGTRNSKNTSVTKFFRSLPGRGSNLKKIKNSFGFCFIN